MTTRFTSLNLFAALIAVTCMVVPSSAQESKYPNAKPMFAHPAPHRDIVSRNPAGASLVQWNGKFTDVTHQPITFTMVGTDPGKSNVTTTIPVVIVPIKLVFGKSNGNMTFDPMKKKLPNGKTIIQNTVASPIFDPSLNFTQGGINLGTTQYIDAWQRGNFWSTVGKTNKKYHVLLGTPTVLAEQSINVPASLGSVIPNPFGSGKVGTYDINAYDANVQTYIKKFAQINPGVLPIFITLDTYLTSGGCCIGGYHNANGAQPNGQTYSNFTYVDIPGSFSQDVSALSHEVGEWLDDPFIDNLVNCQDNGIMEVGDPNEREPNFGGFPYTLNGFTYNLQTLVFIPYFGDKKTTSVHSWYSFQNDIKTFCPGQ